MNVFMAPSDLRYHNAISGKTDPHNGFEFRKVPLDIPSPIILFIMAYCFFIQSPEKVKDIVVSGNTHVCPACPKGLRQGFSE